MDLTLLHMPYSPWSQKARCALRHHGIAVREQIYTPLIGEPALRVRLRQWRGRVTVPVLFTPTGALTDSFAIARYADRIGTAAPLIPHSQLAEITEWNACSERLLVAGRAGAMLRVLEQPEAALENLPSGLRPLLGARVALLTMRAFNAKYGIDAQQRDHYQAGARSELERLRQALADGRRYLTGSLSYADFALASALMLLGPLAESPLGPGMRRASTDAVLAAEFPDLLAWRAALHAQHRLV